MLASALLTISFLVVGVSTSQPGIVRHISFSLNPECHLPACTHPNETDAVNLVVARSVGPRDSVLALWSSVGAPAVLMARCANETKVSIDWNSFLNSSLDPFKNSTIEFSPEPLTVFGVLLRRLVEYDDVDDQADPEYYVKKNKTIGTREYRLDQMQWSPVSLDNDSLEFRTSNLSSLGASLVLKISLSGTLTRGAKLPHLQITPNNSLIDVILDKKPPSYNHSRFYVELVAVNSRRPMAFGSSSSIDDEYTPGVFTSYRLSSHAADDDNVYVEWKPVAYTSESRNLDHLTSAKAFGDAYVDPDIREVRSVVGELFREWTFNRTIKVSFGISQDKFYNNTGYSVWCLVMGFGATPEDAISTLVIVVISFGLGIPFAVLIGSGAYAGLREKGKSRKRKSTTASSGVRAPLVENEQEATGTGSRDYGTVNT